MPKYIKLPVSVLDNPLFGRMPDFVFVGWIKLLLIAAKKDKNGLLPDSDVIAWILRKELHEIIHLVHILIGKGLLFEDEKGFLYINDYQNYIPNPNRFGIHGKWRKLRAKILKRDHETCTYCGGKANHVDHIFPKSRGGEDTPNNLVAACQHCNSSKSAKTPEEAGLTMLFDPRQ